MVVFDIPHYSSSLERDEVVNMDDKPLRKVELGNIGISANPTTDQLQQLKARIFQGASRVELGFSGKGKGSMQGRQTTPEMYGKHHREDIRQLAEINEVKLTTHASYSAGPMSGLVQGRFDPNAREQVLHEIQRAIDFAADTARGGPVVVHSGAFPRNIYESYRDEGFRGFEEEDEKGVMYLVDEDTGKLITDVKKNEEVIWPKWKTDENKEYVTNGDGQLEPVFDPETGEFETQKAGWQEFKKYADWYNKNHPGDEITPAQAYYRATLDANRQYSLGWAHQYAEQYEEMKENLKKYEKAYETYKEIEKNIPEDEMWKIKKQFKQIDRPDIIPPEVERPTEYLEKRIKSMKQQLRASKEMSLSSFQRAAQAKDQADKAVPIENYGIEQSATTIARAAEFAYEKSRELEKHGKLKQPITVSVENIEPEMYGAHPQELKRLILEGRKKFVERYGQRYGEEKAKELAKQHIKATWDIGHAYMWRKYFEGDPDKSFEENTKNFNKWLFNHIDDLNKEEIIDHVHISDNFGYNDEHVTPGQGIIPIKEFVDKMREAGIKDVIVEPAHQDYKAMLGGWRDFGAPIYGSAPPATGSSWSDIQFSYFGQTRTPYFIFGDYSPSRDFTLWTQVPLE